MDSVQINAPEYDSDINSQIDALPDLVTCQKQPRRGNSEDPELSQDTNRTDPDHKSVQNLAEHPPHQDTEPFLEQHQDRQRSQLEDIHKLEDKD